MKLDDVECFGTPQIGDLGSQWSPGLSAAFLRLAPAGWILVDRGLRVIPANEHAQWDGIGVGPTQLTDATKLSSQIRVELPLKPTFSSLNLAR